MKFKFWIIIVSLFWNIPLFASETAKQVLKKAVSEINNANFVKADFSITGEGFNSINGSFEGNNSKFILTLPQSTTWYDGKSMWTSNNQSKQITLVNPTAQEIKEINPFAYLQDYRGKYKVGFSKRKENGKFLILLNPISTAEEIKAIEITLNSKTYLPERFIIRDKNDKKVTVSIKSIRTNIAMKDEVFQCPVENMTDFELVDLR